MSERKKKSTVLKRLCWCSAVRIKCYIDKHCIFRKSAGLVYLADWCPHPNRSCTCLCTTNTDGSRQCDLGFSLYFYYRLVFDIFWKENHARNCVLNVVVYTRTAHPATKPPVL